MNTGATSSYFYSAMKKPLGIANGFWVCTGCKISSLLPIQLQV